MIENNNSGIFTGDPLRDRQIEGRVNERPVETQQKGLPSGSPVFLAGRRGFEPRFTESESVVLPLNDPPVV